MVGRSNLVDKPIAALLLRADVTVTQCHSRTVNLLDMTRQADLLVVANGPRLITSKFVSRGAVVMDVGVHRLPSDEVVGDVDGEVREVAPAMTPVPGGVGPMTIGMLLENTLKARRELT